jgi:hypothetical protein
MKVAEVREIISACYNLLRKLMERLHVGNSMIYFLFSGLRVSRKVRRFFSFPPA